MFLQGRGRKRAKFYNNRDGNLWPIDGSAEVSAKFTNLPLTVGKNARAVWLVAASTIFRRLPRQEKLKESP
jgi:hypothetical protein